MSKLEWFGKLDPVAVFSQMAWGNLNHEPGLGTLYSLIKRTLKCLLDLQPSTHDPLVIAACMVLTHPCPRPYRRNLGLNIDVIKRHEASFEILFLTLGSTASTSFGLACSLIALSEVCQIRYTREEPLCMFCGPFVMHPLYCVRLRFKALLRLVLLIVTFIVPWTFPRAVFPTCTDGNLEIHVRLFYMSTGNGACIVSMMTAPNSKLVHYDCSCFIACCTASHSQRLRPLVELCQSQI